jgi:hypothetical protein
VVGPSGSASDVSAGDVYTDALGRVRITLLWHGQQFTRRLAPPAGFASDTAGHTPKDSVLRFAVCALAAPF